MKNKSLEQIFKVKLGELRIEPSERAIHIFNKKIKKRGRIVLVRRLSIAASILLFCAIGIFYFMPQAGENSLVQENDSIKKMQDTTEKMDIEPIISEKADNHQSASDQIDLKKQVAEGKNDDQEKTGKRNEIIKKSDPAVSNDLIEIPASMDPDHFLMTTDNLTNREDSSILPSSESTGDMNGQLSDVTDLMASETVVNRDPVKITIEYIASGSKNKNVSKQKMNVGELYSKMNNLVYPDEVLGDVRSFKDQLFALDFIKGIKSEFQNKKEK